ncbi:unnamed protein product, partial [Discosporangium mesarthrocarpum]
MSATAGKLNWLDRHKREPPLKLVAFLPLDNDPESSSVAVERANLELGRLLAYPFPMFLSYVLGDESVRNFLDTFLRFRRRHFEAVESNCTLPPPEPLALQELSKRVFMVLLRLVGQEMTAFSEHESGVWVLLAQSGILAPAALLDVCALYERSNSPLLGKLLASSAREPETLVEGVGEAFVVAARALFEVHAQ